MSFKMWYNTRAEGQQNTIVGKPPFFSLCPSARHTIARKAAVCFTGWNMRAKRDLSYRKYWSRLIEIHGPLCYYCKEEVATTIDHVVPYSWDADNEIENLVPACGLCNQLANNKMFDSAEHKRQYIIGERKKRASRRAICSECFLPYTYLAHSPSLFLCAECYDNEYGTNNAKKKNWREWLYDLEQADIYPQAHRNMKSMTGYKTSKEKRLKILAGEYERFQECIAI